MRSTAICVSWRMYPELLTKKIRNGGIHSQCIVMWRKGREADVLGVVYCEEKRTGRKRKMSLRQRKAK